MTRKLAIYHIPFTRIEIRYETCTVMLHLPLTSEPIVRITSFRIEHELRGSVDEHILDLREAQKDMVRLTAFAHKFYPWAYEAREVTS